MNVVVIITFINDAWLSGQGKLFQVSIRSHCNICLWRCHATISQPTLYPAPFVALQWREKSSWDEVTSQQNEEKIKWRFLSKLTWRCHLERMACKSDNKIFLSTILEISMNQISKTYCPNSTCSKPRANIVLYTLVCTRR